MTNEEIVSRLFENLDSRNYETAAEVMDETFLISGVFPFPFNKAMWVGSTKAIHSAFSDFKFNASNYKVNGDQVNFTIKLMGTHDGDLTIPGLPPMPASGKFITIPEERGSARVVNGKIVGMQLEPSENGGLRGILQQLTS